jgi:hypothetical protein
VEFAMYSTTPEEFLEFPVCFFYRKWLSIWLKWWSGKGILSLLNATFAIHLAHLLHQLLLLAIIGVMQVRALIHMILNYWKWALIHFWLVCSEADMVMFVQDVMKWWFVKV